MAIDIGQVAYEGYIASCGGKSIHGEDLPSWQDQAPAIREHWRAAADAVTMFLALAGSAETPSDEDRIRDAMTEAQAHPGRTVTR